MTPSFTEIKTGFGTVCVQWGVRGVGEGWEISFLSASGSASYHTKDWAFDSSSEAWHYAMKAYASVDFGGTNWVTQFKNNLREMVGD